MNNKIKNYCVVTFLCLCVGFVAGSSNLKIFRNIDDTVVEVSSKIEVPSGANLTLICQTENIKNKGIINGYVTWFIPPEMHSKVILKILKNSSNLVFKNVNSNDEGLYVCASLKYKTFKTVRLLLKESESAKSSSLNFSRLTKREILPGNGPYVFNDTDLSIYDRNLDELKKHIAIMQEDLLREVENEKNNRDLQLYNNNYDINFNNRKVKRSKSAKKLSYLNFPRRNKREVIPGIGRFDLNRTILELANKNKATHEDILKDIQYTNNFKNDELNNNFNYNEDLNYNNNMDFNNHKDSTKSTFPVKPVGLIFGVLFVVFVVFLLIRLCGYISQNSSQHARNNRQPNIYNPGVTVPRPNRCGHTSCSGNHLLNPSGACRFQDNILPTAPIIYDEMDIERPRTHNARGPTTDLPPTYSSSTHNSTHNLNDETIGFNKNVLHPSNSDNLTLPPSYDQAIRDNTTASQNHHEGKGDSNN